MNGSCYIDGIDIFDEYGVFIEGDGYDELFSFPAIVDPDKNDWPEENGVEVDLSEVRLQEQEISVTFALLGKDWIPFYAFLNSQNYREFFIPDLKRRWLLKAIEMPELIEYGSDSLFKIKFLEMSREVPDIYTPANADIGLVSSVSVDGKTLDKYGIIIVDGLEEIKRTSKQKKELSPKYTVLSDPSHSSNVKYSEKDVTLKCNMIAPDAETFWSQYDAFLFDMIKPELRYLSYAGKMYSAYYQKSGNWIMLSNFNVIAVEFDITFCFTDYSISI